MRAASVLALVASLLVFTGCCSIGGSGCGDGLSGGCDSGGAGFFGGGISGCGVDNTSASFSDTDCGPMCGAYLSDGQTDGGCGCNDCQMGRPYFGGQFNGQFRGQMAGHVSNWWASARQHRPIQNAVAAGYNSIGTRGPCRGLGSMVGCAGCGECGGGAIGLNHSDSQGLTAGACGACGTHGCGGGCLQKLKAARGARSIHPYGGEIPHTAAAAGGGQGGAAPTYAYPYYTTRGPRDFLMMNPPSIGR